MAWILLSLGDQRLDIGYPQFMRIYLEGCFLYGFDWQRAFRARCMAKNLSASREHGKYDKNNVEHRGNVTTKK